MSAPPAVPSFSEASAPAGTEPEAGGGLGAGAPGGDAAAACPAAAGDTVKCPVCGGSGFERRQKWFCGRCGQLLQTCCD